MNAQSNTRRLALGVLIAIGGVALLSAGCGQSRPAGGDANRILAMAGEEAGQIPAAKERLTRQLNIANRQTDNGRPADARATLAAARQTLESAGRAAGGKDAATRLAEGKDEKDEGLTDHERLAGWVSIAELSREAKDERAAGQALDEALTHLRALQPESARADYVTGVAREVKAQRGDAAAATVLVEGGDWAAKIDDRATRRAAFVAIAADLFRCADYEGGRAVLRHDQDAAWRSDSLTALASAAGPIRVMAYPPMLPAEASTNYSIAPARDTGQSVQSFGKPVDFRSNYYRP